MNWSREGCTIWRPRSPDSQDFRMEEAAFRNGKPRLAATVIRRSAYGVCRVSDFLPAFWRLLVENPRQLGYKPGIGIALTVLHCAPPPSFARMERLPLRVNPRLAQILGIDAAELQVCELGGAPSLRCEWQKPSAADQSIVLRIHARTGVPLAETSIRVAQGDRAFETDELAFLAMEGYAHLKSTDRREVENRVWSRRAYATASVS